MSGLASTIRTARAASGNPTTQAAIAQNAALPRMAVRRLRTSGSDAASGSDAVSGSDASGGTGGSDASGGSVASGAGSVVRSTSVRPSGFAVK